MAVSRVAPQSPGCFVYVANAGDGEIAVLAVRSAESEPQRVQSVPITEAGRKGGMSTPMALSPDRSRLYVAQRLPPLPLTTFAVDRRSGRLTPAGTARLPGSTPYVLTDRTGRVLVSLANPGATLAVSAIGRDGRVASHAHQVLHIGHKLHCIAVDAGNANVYVSSTDDGVIHHFAFDAGAGMLAPADPPAVELGNGGDPRHMAFSPDGRFLHVTTEAGGRVASFAIDPASGRLHEIADVAMMPDGFSARPMTADIHLTPDGRFLYASERVLDTIVAYRVDAETGRLSLIEAVPTEAAPRAFAIAPDGAFMLVAGQKSGRLAAYAIDGATGRLTPGASIAIGAEPNWIEFVERG